VHVPHPLTWALEDADPPEGHARFAALPDIGAFAPWLAARVEAPTGGVARHPCPHI
jgi:putative hydrolase of the HAD superfamily